MKKKYFGLRRSGYTPNFLVILAVIVMAVLIVMIADGRGDAKVKETYTEKHTSIYADEVVQKELVRETVYSIPTRTFLGTTTDEALSLQNIEVTQSEPIVESHENKVAMSDISTEVVSSTQVVQTATATRHYPESTYKKVAITIYGEGGGVPSLTHRSGIAWTICNRVLSPKFPNDIEAVVEQASQFDGYRPNGTYDEASYYLAVDVLERFYRECCGETAEQVGRSIPADYLYFTGDGQENYFRKTQSGNPYVWGSMLISPYKN